MKKQELKSLLVGNGININFGGKAYSNQFIIKRIIFNARAGKYDPLFNGKMSGEQIEETFLNLAEWANAISRGECDSVVTDEELPLLEDFKKRYSKKVEHYYDVGLEDWLFILHIVFLKNADLKNIWGPVKFSFEQMMLDAIYNDGDIQKVYLSMGKPVKRWFEQFDKIFTLNYDNNVETLIKKPIFHLHGDYRTKANSENPNTILGYQRTEAHQTVVVPGFEHCYCNALFDYRGENKLQVADGFEKGKASVQRLADSGVPASAFPAPAAGLVQTYREHPELEIAPTYHFDEFRKLSGEVHIIGMSPNNDSHLFRLIDASAVDKVVFYYFSESEKKQKLQLHQKVEYRSAPDLWKSLKAAPKKYSCNYDIPKSPQIDGIFDFLGEISGDPVSKADIIKEVNSIPEFRAKELCKLVDQEIKQMDKKGSPKDEKELKWRFGEVSRIALRNGVMPAALLVHYTMTLGK